VLSVKAKYRCAFDGYPKLARLGHDIMGPIRPLIFSKRRIALAFNSRLEVASFGYDARKCAIERCQRKREIAVPSMVYSMAYAKLPLSDVTLVAGQSDRLSHESEKLLKLLQQSTVDIKPACLGLDACGGPIKSNGI